MKYGIVFIFHVFYLTVTEDKFRAVVENDDHFVEKSV